MDFGLSSQQVAVICALSSGATMTAAADQAGVARNTIHNWRRNLLPFQRALAGAQYDRALFFREKLEELVDLAIQAIQEILIDPKASPSVRLRAALAVVNIASAPPAPKKQVELLLESVAVQPLPQKVQKVHKDAQPGTQTEPAPSDPAASPEPDPPTVHNSAQPIRREQPKIGRNEPCPCGSGLKYKRCCLNKPHPNTNEDCHT